MSSLLYGTHTQTVDDRYRVAVPSKLTPVFREISGAGPDEDVELVVTVSLDQGVGAYPKKVYERLMDRLDQHGDQVKARKLKRIYQKNREDVVLDRQNRFRIPSILARKHGLSGEIVITGMGEWLALSSFAEWEKSHEKEVGSVENLHDELGVDFDS